MMTRLVFLFGILVSSGTVFGAATGSIELIEPGEGEDVPAYQWMSVEGHSSVALTAQSDPLTSFSMVLEVWTDDALTLVATSSAALTLGSGIDSDDGFVLAIIFPEGLDPGAYDVVVKLYYHQVGMSAPALLDSESSYFYVYQDV